MLASFVGIAALFVSSVPDIITWGLDGIAGIVFFAGGIVSCASKLSLQSEHIIFLLDEG